MLILESLYLKGNKWKTLASKTQGGGGIGGGKREKRGQNIVDMVSHQTHKVVWLVHMAAQNV
jgi:hypothetical protein